MNGQFSKESKILFIPKALVNDFKGEDHSWGCESSRSFVDSSSAGMSVIIVTRHELVR